MTTAILFVAGLVLLVGGAEGDGARREPPRDRPRREPARRGADRGRVRDQRPGLAVGVSSAVGGSADIALGNVVGSNIANVLLVLGLAALVMPVTTGIQLVRREVPLMIATSIMLWLMAIGGEINRLEGVLLLAGIFAYTAYVVRASRRRRRPSGSSSPRSSAQTPRWDRGSRRSTSCSSWSGS